MTAQPVALVTGASRGIGAAIATALGATHRVLLAGRDERTLARIAESLPAAQPLPMDLTDLASLGGALTAIDRLDVLVHSAGGVTIASLDRTPVEVWRQTLELNVVAVAELTRLLLPALRAATGRVVLINSGQGIRASAGWGAYAASKFALRAYADVLRAEEEANGVRVTSVFPGRTATDMQREVRSAEGGEFNAADYLRPESVADAVRFAIEAPADAHLTELTLRPTGR
jgi:NADP-dependent 3-hydroxy acid dehydrogenase YdfG